MDLMVHGLVGAYFIFKFLHFGIEKILSRTLGFPYPVAEALTWILVGVIAAVIYRKWRR